MSRKQAFRGTMIAAAAAGLFMTGSVTAALGETKAETVKCYGVNSCRGHGQCAAAANDCAGKNSCKGKGWLKLSAAECRNRGGTVK